MAKNTPNISEIYTANETTKQFTLSEAFDAFAKSKGLNEEGIRIAKGEIQKRFDSYNAEQMDIKRYNRIQGMMESFVNNEISKAKSVLIGVSLAMKDVLPNVDTSNGQNKNSIYQAPSGENKQIATGVLNAVPVLQGAIANRRKQLDTI